jgi:hypothetical protein
MNKRKRGESPFIVFRHGCATRIDMNIIENITELLTEFNKGNQSMEEILKMKIEPIKDGMGEGVSNKSIWFKMIEELNDESKLEKRDKNIMPSIFDVIVKSKSEKELWRLIKKIIVKKIDTISAWEEYKIIRNYNMISNIQRCNDGSYIGEIDGEQVILHGIKTRREEKYDYIVKSLLDEYAPIQLLLKFIATIMVIINYSKQPLKYPDSVNIYLGENKVRYTWFLHWKWHINRPFGYMPIEWRPENVLCDEQWLASDLLAAYCKKYKILIPNEPIFEQPTNELLDKYKNNFSGPERSQLACVVDTDLCLSSNGQKYFDFKGIKIRWIDPTSYRKAVIVTPIMDGLNKNEVNVKLEILNQFISMMVFNYDMPIVKSECVIGPASYTPMTGASRGASCFIYTSPMTAIYNSDARKMKLMMSFYKEAINSKSVYYKVLNYTKIIEAYVVTTDNQIRLVNENIGILKRKGYEKRISSILENNDNLGLYIYESCRCAVAHAGKRHNISPDKIDDYNRMILDEPLIKCLAREIIVNKSNGIRMLSEIVE